jgi:hypothetical protein
VLRATEESLDRSNKTILLSSEKTYRLLQNRVSDPLTKEIAQIWQPITMHISELSSKLVKCIDSIKYELKDEALGIAWDESIISTETKYAAVKKIMFEKNRATELGTKLRNYRQAILNLDGALTKQLGNDVIKANFEYLDSGKNRQLDFANTFFDHSSLAATLSTLTKIQNDLFITENNLVEYCYSRTASCGLNYYTTFKTLLAISSSCVKSGDEIEISAGIGSFSVLAQPVMIIRGKKIDADPDGVVIYKFKTPQKPGKYSVPVKIIFTKPDGIKDTFGQAIPYTVME